MKRILAALLLTATILTIGIAAANADAQPPTNGGNGAGQSGQCTGNPDDRPAVCPATK
jgi:Spy/CpxP family protein refolding chaperone